MAGVWGKLRGHGDFLALGLDDTARACVVPWLDASLASLRVDWAQDWESRFDAMAPIGFWIGPLIGGGAAIAGVMAASQDQVGRRYPLLILGRGEMAPPMLIASGFHTAAAEALAALLAAGRADGEVWPRALDEATLDTAGPNDPSLVWARNPGRAGTDVLAEIRQFDHVAAAAGRVQLWTLGAPGAVLSCAGLPSARALRWLLEASQDATGSGPDAPVDGHHEVMAPPPAAPISQPASKQTPATTALRLAPEMRIVPPPQSAMAVGTDHAEGASGRLILRSEWVLSESEAAVWQVAPMSQADSATSGPGVKKPKGAN